MLVIFGVPYTLFSRTTMTLKASAASFIDVALAKEAVSKRRIAQSS